MHIRHFEIVGLIITVITFISCKGNDSIQQEFHIENNILTIGPYEYKKFTNSNSQQLDFYVYEDHKISQLFISTIFNNSKSYKLFVQNGSNEYAGIVGLDYDLDNQVIGDKLPDIKSVNLIGLLLDKYGIKNGDRTNVVRTELYKKFAPMKVFPGEKNFNPHYMHLQISLEYDFLVLNENLRYVDYQDSGMTNSMLWQYYNSPNSFAEIRKMYLSLPGTSFPFRVKNTIHLFSSYILAKKASSAVRENPYHLLTIFMFPVGFVFSLYIKIKNRNV